MPPSDDLSDRITALEQENERLRAMLQQASDDRRFVDSVLENLPDMVFVKDAAELRFVRLNAAGEAIVGHPRAALIGRNDFDFFPEEQAQAFVAKDREVLASGRMTEIAEEPIETPSGRRYLHTKKIPLYDEEGTARFLLGISEDITERKQALEALGRAEARRDQSEGQLRVLMHRFPGAMWTTDDTLRVQTTAGAAASAIGLGRATGELVADVLPPAGPDQDVAALHRAALGGEPVVYEFHQGGRTWESRLERLVAGDDRGVIGVAVDVTEQRRLDAERLRSTLERVQRMETLGILAGGIAHDFNNLLTAILGNTSLAVLHLPPGSPGSTELERVTASAETAAELTRQLLAYSGKGRFVVEPMDLSTLVESIGGLMRVSLGKDTVLHLRLAPDLPTCLVDGTQIRQVVLNLLTNARDAIAVGGGSITLTTSVVLADRDYLALAWLDESLPPGRYVCLEVADTGVGMAPEVVNRMFDPFFTTKPRGHGLGLAATLGIVRGHRGAIRVYSEPGQGTTIKVLLPASTALRTDPVPSAAEQLPARRATILVVDDDDAIRSFACRALELRGHRTFAAVDGLDALEKFQQEPSIEAVLLDLTMPRMSGEETLLELMRLRPSLVVVLSSGYNEQQVTNQFVGKGLAGFLQKPYRAASLYEMIDQATSGRRVR